MQEGDTPLINATISGSEAVVKMLLEAGADKNVKRQVMGWGGRSGRSFDADVFIRVGGL